MMQQYACHLLRESRALKPYEKSMRNYSSAKLELSHLKVVSVREIQGLSHWQ